MLFLTLGGLFAIGLLADLIGRYTLLPRVTVLIVSGVLVGPSLLAIVPQAYVDLWFPSLTTLALAMIGFLLGQSLTLDEIRTRGMEALFLALAKVVFSALAVFLALLLLGLDWLPALLLGAIAAATDPAATYDVVRESGSKGPFTSTLLRIVAMDDALALMWFAIVVATAKMITGFEGNGFLLAGLWEVFGSLLLGVLLGIPMAYLTGRISSADDDHEPIMVEALGFVLICAGCAQILGLSAILAAMAMGATVATFATHHKTPFSAIEGIEWPFMILFFVLAGAALRIEGMMGFVVVAVVYILARTLGAQLGVASIAKRLQTSGAERRWLGLALLPQAGIAIGMALIASQEFPQHAELLLTCTLFSTVVLEIAAPIITRRILRHVGETSLSNS
ncbi:MAG: cation:proton antiporter [Pseudomonadales bacterium]